MGLVALVGDIWSPDGIKHIGRCASVASLRTIEPTQNIQLIRTISYYEGLAPEMPRGGGDYEYDPDDTSTPDDGILTIVTTGGARWKRVLTNLSLTCFDAGVYPSGGDDTEALNNLFSTVASYRLTHGRFRLDMMGLDFTSTVGNTIEFDPNRIELVDFTIENTLYETTTAFAIVRCKPTIPFQSGIEYVKGNVDRLIIKDATRHTDSPVTALHLTSDVNGAFSSVIFNGLNIASPKNGIAFGNHCYLVTFNNAHITAYSDLTDAITAGLETTITDAGENYVFNAPVFSGTQIFNWDNIEGEFNVYGGSGDFIKGGINKRSGFVLGWYGGHFEFNNVYEKWFESSAVATVIFKPSRVLSVSGSATDFFYDSSSSGNSLKVDLDIGSWGGNTVGAMINTMLRSDRCASIQGFQPPVRGRLNRYLVDGTFKESSIMDGWYADANASRTSRLVSDTTTLTRGTTTNGNGNTVGCLTMTKLSTVGSGFPSGSHLICKVPRGDTPAHVKFKYTAPADTPITVTVRLVSIISIDGNGVPTFGKRVITAAATTLTASTTEKEYVSSVGLNVDSDYQRYDYVQVSISMFSAAANSAPVSIYDVLINKIG
ncbi:tail fiber protein [Klebsiella phage VLCpiA1b]|nr:tail fiber protein [Klebsiella phage VLCpiA1b]